LEGATTVVKSSHQQTFSYVIGSSATSHSASSYPGFDTIAGKYYFTTHSEIEGTDRHYNWWIGRGGIIIEPSENPDTEIDVDTDGDKKPDVNIDINGDGKPDTNIDSDGDGWPDTNLKPGGSGDGSGGGGGGASSSVEIPPKEDNGSYKGWDLFNPFDYDYTPPDSDYNYDPMEGYETPDDLKIPIDFDIPDNNEYHNPFWVPEWAKNKG
jgi:hypothetical protein